MRCALSVVCLLVSFTCAARAEEVPPGQVVVPIDPAVDLIGTRPGWSGLLAADPCGPLARPKPLASPPFSASEVVKMAKQAKRFLPRRPGQAGPDRIASGDGRPPIPVPEYVAELNQIEGFLNQFGASLREAGTLLPHRGRTLGTVARLRRRSAACPPTPDDELKPVPPDWTVFARVDDPLRPNPLVRRLFERGQVFRVEREQVRARPDLLETLRWRDAARPQWLSRRHVRAAPPRTAPGAGGFRLARFDARAPFALDLSSVRLAADRLRFDSRVLPGFSIETKVMSCPALNPVCPGGEPGCEKSAGAESETGGGWTKTKGKKTTCLAKGDFVLDLLPWNACVNQSAGFGGWFGAESCITLRSANAGDDGAFTFSSSLGMESGLTVFGVSIPLVEVSAAARFDSKTGPQAAPPTIGGLVPGLGAGSKCCDDIPGPSAVIPLASGLSLVISSALHIAIDPAQVTTLAQAPPSGCGAVSTGLAPLLGLNGKATAKSSATLEAALSAYVAKTGVVGELVFTDDVLEGRLDTLIDVPGNLLRVHPAMTYRMKRLAGRLLAFVEVDLLVVSKRWDIELADWDGYETARTLAKDPADVSAVSDPALACPGDPAQP